MISIYSGSLISGASFALAFWSYIPLYALPFAIGACLLKVQIEVCDHCQLSVEVALILECSRRGLSCRIRNLVMNIGHTGTGFHTRLFHMSGESPQRRPDTSWIELYIYVHPIRTFWRSRNLHENLVGLSNQQEPGLALLSLRLHSKI